MPSSITLKGRPVWARAPPAPICVCEGGGGGRMHRCLGHVCAAPCGRCGDASWGGGTEDVFVFEVQV